MKPPDSNTYSFPERFGTLKNICMRDVIYIVRYTGNTDPTDHSTQEVVGAAHVEVDGNCVFFMHCDGTIVASFDRTIILDRRIVTEDELARL